jgi:hypothetical protein
MCKVTQTSRELEEIIHSKGVVESKFQDANTVLFSTHLEHRYVFHYAYLMHVDIYICSVVYKEEGNLKYFLYIHSAFHK